jgi:hypothetical protein
MLRQLVAAALCLPALAGLVLAEPIRGKVKAADAARETITITTDKQDRELAIVAATRIVGSDGKELKDRLKNKAFLPGAPVVVTLDKDAKVAELKVGYPPMGYLDEAAAGPDALIQGEYEGTIAGKKWGAQVAALNAEGLFTVQFLGGGLPGDWKGTLAAGKLAGKTGDGSDFTLARVERGSPTLGAKPPPGAIVLFDGNGLEEWPGGQLVEGKYLAPGFRTKRTFNDFKLHLEFRLPFRDRANGNSGVYLLERYEIQIFNSFGHLPARNNGCGSIYTTRAEDVNMTYPPLAWQTYDIEFAAPRWDEQGKKIKNAVVTVLHNGVVVHDKVEVQNKTGNGKPEGATAAPIYLQNHGSPVQYRNIWVVTP